MARTDDHRSDRAVEMSGLALGVLDTGTVGTMDGLGLGREIPGAIQRDQLSVAHSSHGLQQTRPVKGLVEIVENAEQMSGFNWIEHLADVVVTGNALDLKEGARVVGAVGLLHGPLDTQERRALGKEYRKSRQTDVGYAVAGIVAGAPVGQSGGDTAQAFDQLIEAAPIHGH